jgi:putative ABC transport system permease protein
MWDDVRYALRLLVKSPGYAAVAMVTLTIGIGGTVAIFSAVYSVLLAPLPYPDADAIVVPVSTNAARGFDRASVPYADYLDWREQRDVFAHVAVWRPVPLDVAGTGAPERVDAGLVSAGFFDVLGVKPIAGRTFEPADHEAGPTRGAVISYGLWQRALGGAPDVLARTLRIGGTPVPIVGVLGPRAVWPDDQALWLPLKPSQFDEDERSRRDNMIFESIARLKPGISLQTGRARVAAIAERVAREHPESRKGWSTDLIPLRGYVVDPSFRDALIVLLIAVGAVLLIVCVNVANLLLARGTSRARELAIRTALGASRSRVARQLLTESIVLAIAGGAGGVALAVALIRVLVRLAPDGVPFVSRMAINLPALAAAGGLALTSLLLFGILPALAGSRQKPAGALKDNSAGSGASGRTLRLRDGLVVAEMALAVVLMVSAGLLVRSFNRIVHRSPGVDVDHVIAARISLPGRRYPQDADAVRFYQTLTRALTSVHGVTAAAATSYLPAGGGGFGLGRVFLIEGEPEPPSGPDHPANWNVITPDYFRTVGIPLLRGRAFNEHDIATSTPVIVINETLARRMFPGADAIGRRIRSWRDENVLRQIVGVVADVRYSGLADQDRGLVYVPHQQNSWGVMVVAVRATGNPAALAGALRETVTRIDPTLGLGRLGTLSEFASASVSRERFSAALLAAFAGVAVLLAAVGIYGVMAYVVAARRHELGVRAALGATPRQLYSIVVRHGLTLTLIGGAIGFVGSLAAGRALSGLLFGVSGADPVTMISVGVLLPLVSLTACSLPARRAARVDPAVTLRSE